MIELVKEDQLWIVTINRPDRANALNTAMLEQLADIAKDATGARAFILTGAGNVFSAGADLKEVKEGSLASNPVWERLSANIAALPGLTVAALNGTLAGGAFGMALACDLRIGVPDAHYFYPVMKMGVAPQPSDPARLVALIGPSRAKMMLMAGQKIDSDTAHRWGLIDNVAVPGGALRHARTLVAGALESPLDRTRLIKNMVNKSIRR